MNITQYKEFAKAMRESESSNQYDIENRLGYLGAYQFGKPRLWDLGISIDGWNPKNSTVKQHFTPKQFFLNSKTLQDGVFALHVIDALEWIKRKKYKRNGFTDSALVAVFHLLGYGGVMDFVKMTNNYLGQDANGTKAIDYAKKFNNIF